MVTEFQWCRVLSLIIPNNIHSDCIITTRNNKNSGVFGTGEKYSKISWGVLIYGQYTVCMYICESK